MMSEARDLWESSAARSTPRSRTSCSDTSCATSAPTRRGKRSTGPLAEFDRLGVAHLAEWAKALVSSDA